MLNVAWNISYFPYSFRVFNFLTVVSDRLEKEIDCLSLQRPRWKLNFFHQKSNGQLIRRKLIEIANEINVVLFLWKLSRLHSLIISSLVSEFKSRLTELQATI